MRFELLMLLTVIFLSTGDIYNNSTTYRSLTDGYNGFYRVIDTRTGTSLPYENNTFNINVGDNIIWVNDDPSDTITIISEQKLWKNNSAVLRHTGGQFNYTFNESGIYTFYIEQFQGFPKQTIIVSENISIIDNSVNDTNTTDVNETDMAPIVTSTMTTVIVPIVTAINETIINDTAINNINTMNTTNVTNISTENIISTNPVLMPLDISKNFKIVGFVSFVIIMIIFFIKD